MPKIRPNRRRQVPNNNRPLIEPHQIESPSTHNHTTKRPQQPPATIDNHPESLVFAHTFHPWVPTSTSVRIMPRRYQTTNPTCSGDQTRNPSSYRQDPEASSPPSSVLMFSHLTYVSPTKKEVKRTKCTKLHHIKKLILILI